MDSRVERDPLLLQRHFLAQILEPVEDDVEFAVVSRGGGGLEHEEAFAVGQELEFTAREAARNGWSLAVLGSPPRRLSEIWPVADLEVSCRLKADA